MPRAYFVIQGIVYGLAGRSHQPRLADGLAVSRNQSKSAPVQLGFLELITAEGGLDSRRLPIAALTWPFDGDTMASVGISSTDEHQSVKHLLSF